MMMMMRLRKQSETGVDVKCKNSGRPDNNGIMFTLRPRRNSGGASVLNWWRPSDNEHGPVLIASVLFIFSSFAWASLFSQIWRGWLKVITNTQTSQSSHNKRVRGSISAKFGQVPETNARNVWVGCDKEWRQGIKVIFLDRQTLAWPNPSYLRIVFRSFTATNFGSFCSTRVSLKERATGPSDYKRLPWPYSIDCGNRK